LKFGTDGLRGIAGIDLTPELALRLGFFTATILVPELDKRFQSHFVVGKDPRLSSDMLEAALCSGIMMSGANVIRTGVVSTPVVPFILKKGGLVGGFMITASHNPIRDNGIKVFGADGFKIHEITEKKIERLLNNRIYELSDIAPRFGRSSRDWDLRKSYVRFIKKQAGKPLVISSSKSKTNLKTVFDCAYGATSELCKEIFNGILDSPHYVNAEFDGSRINYKCGATDLSLLASEVVKKRADIGFAFDGDGDRVLVVDNEGNEIDGDKILGILAVNNPIYAKSRGIVATVMSNLGLEEFLSEHGICLYRENVGDKYVMQGLIQRQLLLGGEQSGHIVMLDKSNSGDGLLTTASIIALINQSGRSIKQLTSEIKKYPQILENVHVARKDGWEHDKEVQACISDLTKKCSSSSRLLIRPSGTEPLIRVMAESRDPSKAQMLVKEAVRVIENWNTRVNSVL
jgi:phosphoglucosamine mutase